MTADQPVDVQRFIDARGLSLVQVLLLVLCFLVVAVDGFDIASRDEGIDGVTRINLGQATLHDFYGRQRA